MKTASLAKTAQFLAIATLTLFLQITSNCALAVPAQPQTKNEASHQIENLIHDTKQNADDIAIIRRDELNYRTEKDILKEIYSSHIETTGLVISAVSISIGFIFAFFGYLGFKSIGKLRDDYSEELREARKLKVGLELEIELLRKKQESTQAELEKLGQTQHSNFQLLEISEKVAALIGMQNYEWAIENINAGLNINPNYPHLLRQLALCLGRQLKYEDAENVHKKLLEVDPKDVGHILNYAELLLISGKAEAFNELYEKHKIAIDNSQDGKISMLLNFMKFVQQGDADQAKIAIQPIIEGAPTGNSLPISWQFDDFNVYVAAMPQGELRTYVEKVIAFLSGRLPKEALQAPQADRMAG